jgi:hypothetical protein
MNDFTDRSFIDKVLDAGLKEYSRVTPPANFVVRRPRPRATWGWLLVPAAATVAMVMMMRPAPLPSTPQRLVVAMEVPALQKSNVVEAVGHRPHVHYRTLTAVEIARLDILPELFAVSEAKPMVDLEIKPLEGNDPTKETKE